MGTLYIVATPVGNLEDITLRALRILGEVAVIATEDTRTTRKLLTHFQIDCPLISYHEHSKPAQIERILQTLQTADVALVSEAGTPLLSDPGYRLVQNAIQHKIPVVSIPGPSAVMTALPVSGLPTDQFIFMGFLPRKQNQRRRTLKTVQSYVGSLIFYESPHRLVDTLCDMLEILGESRKIALCRELTKRYEEIWRGTLAIAYTTWQTRQIRGEFTLVVEGAGQAIAWSQTEIEQALQTAKTDGLTTKDAVRAVTTASNWSKREVYRLAQTVYEKS